MTSVSVAQQHVQTWNAFTQLVELELKDNGETGHGAKSRHKKLASDYSVLKQAGIPKHALELITNQAIGRLKRLFAEQIDPLLDSQQASTVNRASNYEQVISLLHGDFTALLNIFELVKVSEQEMDPHIRQYRAHLYASLSPAFYSCTTEYFSHNFSQFEILFRTYIHAGKSPLALCSPSLPNPFMDVVRVPYPLPTSSDDEVMMDIFIPSDSSTIPTCVDNSIISQAEPTDELDMWDVQDILDFGNDGTETQGSAEELENELGTFVDVCSKMKNLGLIARTENFFTEILYQKISERTRAFCENRYDERLLATGLKWVKCVVLSWLSLVILQRDGGTDVQKLSNYQQWKVRLEYHLYKTFGDLRIAELFDIIVEYPDSSNAVEDLKQCLLMTDQKQQLLESLRSALQRRLLHPGANTSDILTQYISCIKALRILEPTGVLLDHVTQPVRAYLKTREDTIRCIVTSLVDDQNNDLLEDLAGEPIVLDEDDLDDFDDENWMPEPVDAGPNYRMNSKRSADIISMLVNIYETKDVFIKEFQLLLADRLLHVTNYDTDNEVRNLELLKLRFGENSFHTCEVMIKDIADSKRINNYVHADTDYPTDAPLHSLVLSRLFWPSFRKDQLRLPDKVVEWQKEYQKSYETLKAARRLEWQSHLGTVNVSIELEDRTVQASVSPVQASIVTLFEEKGKYTWQDAELAESLDISADAVRRAITLWISKGVIKQASPGTFVLLECAEDAATKGNAMLEDTAEPSSALQSAAEQEAEELRIYWAFIRNFLSNFGAQTLTGVHQMLTDFTPDYNRTPKQLEAFLNMMVREDHLEVSNGMYNIRK